MTTLREPLKAQPNKSDISLYPSYTRLVIPYWVICRQRYARNSQKYKAFFEKQHQKIERLQPHALDAVRFHRMFCDDFKGLPEVIRMTQKQKKRLQYLLENPHTELQTCLYKTIPNKQTDIYKYCLKMFKNSFQSGFVTILYAGGTRPLAIWDQTVKNGHIRRVTDEEVQTLAVEVMGTNVATTYISCPPDKKQTLGIRLPFFVMIVKNLNKYFTFEIQILDDKNMSRRFRVSNYQSTTRVRPFSTALPIGLTPGWNQIQFNLADFTRRAYGSTYLETLRVHIHANIRIRRIFFSDRLYAEDELPLEFRLYVPMEKQKTAKQAKGMKDKGKMVDEKVSEREQEIREHIKKSLEKLPPDASPSGAPPSPNETARDEDSVAETVEFVVAPAEKQASDYKISTEEPTEPETMDAEDENIGMILPSEDGEMQGEADIAEEDEIEMAQEATEQIDADTPEPEEEIVFTDPVSEPEESAGPSDAELSEALTDVELESEPEAEIEVEE